MSCVVEQIFRNIKSPRQRAGFSVCKLLWYAQVGAIHNRETAMTKCSPCGDKVYQKSVTLLRGQVDQTTARCMYRYFWKWYCRIDDEYSEQGEELLATIFALEQSFNFSATVLRKLRKR